LFILQRELKEHGCSHPDCFVNSALLIVVKAVPDKAILQNDRRKTDLCVFKYCADGQKYQPIAIADLFFLKRALSVLRNDS